MKPELERKNNGKYTWNPRYGEEYPLGYHHGKVCGVGMSGQKEIRGYFLGSIDGEYKFFREEEGEVLFYSSYFQTNARFSGGDDEPSFPYVVSQFEGILKGDEKQLALKTIKRLENINN